MSELFGLSFSGPVGPTEYFTRFLKRGVINRDGWGISWYPDESVQIFKEPAPGESSGLAGVIGASAEVRGRIYVGHVRKTSGSAVTHENTHPFHRELFGRDFVFAHDGDVGGVKTVPACRFLPVGDTDSERAFCRILARLAERPLWTASVSDFEWLAGEMSDINRFGRFSCLLSDGDVLLCRRDAKGENGLSFLTTRIGTNRGVVVASEQLSDERWVSFLPGELMAFRQGHLVYFSTGRSG